MKRDKILYSEVYGAGAQVVRKDLLPARLPYMAKGFEIASMEVTKAGRIEHDGETFEFQDIRVLVRPATEGDRAVRLKVRDGWEGAGRICKRLALSIGPNELLGQAWAPVLFDDEDDPEFFKAGGLEPFIGEPCWTCCGRGMVNHRACPDCGGTGFRDDSQDPPAEQGTLADTLTDTVLVAERGYDGDL